jgi:hypothetical protein
VIAENSLGTSADNLAIVLYDMHQEYTGGLESLPYRLSTSHVRCERIWDFYALSETAYYLRGDQNIEVAEEQVLNAFLTLFPDLAKHHDISDLSDCTGAFWRIQGNIMGINRVFLHLKHQLSDPPSGDDDTFDYWPGAMRMLHELAVDLDSILGSNDFREQYRPLTLLAGEWADDIDLPDRAKEA